MPVENHRQSGTRCGGRQMHPHAHAPLSQPAQRSRQPVAEIQIRNDSKVRTSRVGADRCDRTQGDRVVAMIRRNVQQAGKPTGLCRRPADTFAARFVDWPAMNLMQCRLDGSTLPGGHVRIDGFGRAGGPVTRGFGNLDAGLGDGGHREATAPKRLCAGIDDDVSPAVPAAICHLFDASIGARVGGCPPAPRACGEMESGTEWTGPGNRENRHEDETNPIGRGDGRRRNRLLG